MYLINRLLMSILSRSSPFLCLFWTPPNYNKLYIFNCLYYLWLESYSWHKLEPRSLPKSSSATLPLRVPNLYQSLVDSHLFPDLSTLSNPPSLSLLLRQWPPPPLTALSSVPPSFAIGTLILPRPRPPPTFIPLPFLSPRLRWALHLPYLLPPP